MELYFFISGGVLALCCCCAIQAHLCAAWCDTEQESDAISIADLRYDIAMVSFFFFLPFSLLLERLYCKSCIKTTTTTNADADANLHLLLHFEKRQMQQQMQMQICICNCICFF